jgi:hypothetical protein
MRNPPCEAVGQATGLICFQSLLVYMQTSYAAQAEDLAPSFCKCENKHMRSLSIHVVTQESLDGSVAICLPFWPPHLRTCCLT